MPRLSDPAITYARSNPSTGLSTTWALNASHWPSSEDALNPEIDEIRDVLSRDPTMIAFVAEESFAVSRTDGRIPVIFPMSDAKLSTAMRMPSQSSEEMIIGVATPLVTMGKDALEGVVVHVKDEMACAPLESANRRRSGSMPTG